MMRRTFPILIFFSIVGLAPGQSINIQNASFETASLTLNVGAGPYCNVLSGSTVAVGGTLANWTASGSTNNGAAGAYHPPVTPTWWVGNNVGYVYVFGPGTVSLSQTLSATLQNETTYTLTALIASVPTFIFNYSLQLWAGSTMVVSASHLEQVTNFEAGVESLTYSSGANNPLAGQPLIITIQSAGSSQGNSGVFFDNLTLTAATGAGPPSPAQFTISTIAGNGIAGYAGDNGIAFNAEFNDIRSATADSAGNIYVADLGNNRIRKISANGIVTTVAGNGFAGFSGDGGPATTASLNQPIRAEPDAAGNLYIADAGNGRIRKVSSNGIITTIAGNGGSGPLGDGGPATEAALLYPGDVAFDSAGDMFISDGNGNRVRKVDTDGIITTVAGNGTAGYAGDGGPATQASLNNPNALTIDSAGNLYISDQYNNRIRKVSNGTITTVVGNGTAAYNGDGIQASAAAIYYPVGTALDAAGDLYVADAGNSRIRVVLPGGIIYTVAGNGIFGFGGDGDLATAAEIASPHRMSLMPSGGLVFPDSDNYRIRVLTPTGQKPAIMTGGINSAGDFGGFSSIAPGTWIEIKGSNLTSSALRNNCGGGIAGSCWAGSDFNNNVAPTSLDGVSVSVGGQPAYIDYTSPGQVNALVPSNAPTGASAITLTNANGTTDPYAIQINAREAGVLAPAAFIIGGKQYVAAILPDGSFALPQNAIPGVASRPAEPGETIVIYGIGFGPVLPNINAGTIVTEQNQLSTPIQFLFGNTAVTPGYFGLAPYFTGLYQFNVVVPSLPANGALALSFNLGAATSAQTLYIAVQ
jgi:uncharacterized protein (TIGR03437 family)